MTQNSKSKQKASLDKVQCPQCGASIPITEAIQHQLSERLEEMENRITQREGTLTERERDLEQAKKAIDQQVQQKLQLERTKLEQDTQKKVMETVSLELRDLRSQIDEKDKKLEEMQKTELALRKRERDIEEAKRSIDRQVQEKVQVELAKVEQDVQKRATEALSVEMHDLRTRIEEKDKELGEMKKAELGLRKRERGLEASKKDLELQVARTIAAEREKLVQETITRVTEDHRLKGLEKDRRIDDMRRQIDDLKRKAEQGSQQLQGEVQELDLEEYLRETFPFDAIQPVAKGVRGADVLQGVHTRSGTFCGTILWESKRTKNWSESWIAKLKEDQQEAKANIAIIVSDVLPKTISSFGFYENVWVTNRSSLPGLATALRASITEVALTKLATKSKDEKIEMLFQYLTSPEFKQRVEGMVETFVAMKEDLDKEKRATITRWGRQEKQIERAIAITGGFYGDLQGLIGSSMQSIPALEAGEAISEESLGNNDVEEQ